MTRYMSASDSLRQKIAVDSACVIKMDEKVDKTNKDLDRPVVKLWFVDISDFGRTSQFLLLSSAIFVAYLIYGYLQVILVNNININTD